MTMELRKDHRLQVQLRAVLTFRDDNVEHLRCHTKDLSKEGIGLVSLPQEGNKPDVGAYVEAHIELPRSNMRHAARSLHCQGIIAWVQPSGDQRVQIGLEAHRMHFVDSPGELFGEGWGAATKMMVNSEAERVVA